MDRIRSTRSPVEIVAARDEDGELHAPGRAYEAVVDGEPLAKMCLVQGTVDEWAVSLLPRPRQVDRVTGEGAAQAALLQLAELELVRRDGVTR